MAREKSHYIFESKNIRKDGTVFPVQINVTVVKDKKGKVQFRAIHVQDITERKRMAGALRESEKRFRAIFEQTADSVVLIDATTMALVEFDGKTHEDLGYTREEFQKIKLFDLEVLKSAEEITKHIEKIVKEGTDTFETKFRSKGGEIHEILITCRVISIDDRNFIQGIWRDITKGKQTELELQEYQKELQSLAMRISEVEEIQRKKIAQKLHDLVGQNLTALNLNLDIVESLMSKKTRSVVAHRLAEAQKLVEETTWHIREVMSELRPSVLDDFGLVSTLYWYGERFSGLTGLQINIEGKEFSPRLPSIIETIIFRIAQEALTNVSKHAEASQVDLRLEKVGDQAPDYS